MMYLKKISGQRSILIQQIPNEQGRAKHAHSAPLKSPSLGHRRYIEYLWMTLLTSSTNKYGFAQQTRQPNSQGQKGTGDD